MNEIRALVHLATRRLGWTSYLGVLHLVALVGASLVLVLMLADRSTAASFVPWAWVLSGLGVVVVGLAAILWSRRRPTEMQVAIRVDDQLDLREKISTAMQVSDRDDPFARAAVEDAVRVASDAKTREALRRRFAVQPPPNWWITPLLVLVTFVASYLPQADLFADDTPVAQDDANAARPAEVVQAVDQVIESIKALPELSEAMADTLGELSEDPLGAEMQERTPEERERAAMKKVTSLNKRLDDILNGEQGKALDALKKSLGQLEMPKDGLAKDLAEAMAKGDFKQAQKALQELAAKAQDGGLAEDQKQALAEQLEKLADQLENLAAQQKALEQALQQAGMDPQLAQNPQALQQAMQNNPNLNQQQQQQLQQMQQAQQAAAQACQNMGGAMQKMAQAMQQGGQQGQMQQGQQAMQQALNQAEMMQMLLQQAQAAANQCQGQCQGQGMGQGLQWGQQQQQGMGQGQKPGQGRGGEGSEAATPYRVRLELAKSQFLDGDVIARIEFQGEQVVGESKVQLREVAATVLKNLDDGLAEDQLPRKYHEAQKHYFGELMKRTEAIIREEAPAPATPPAGAPTPAPAPAPATPAGG